MSCCFRNYRNNRIRPSPDGNSGDIPDQTQYQCADQTQGQDQENAWGSLLKELGNSKSSVNINIGNNNEIIAVALLAIAAVLTGELEPCALTGLIDSLRPVKVSVK